jgi:ABC-type antimicrobial peptide transport system permease subunit
MRFTDLLIRSLRHYWRTNLAVVLGVATAVTVLGGALLVGDSVRGSLRDLALQRLGNTDLAISSAEFFTDGLAGIANDPEFSADFAGLAQVIVLPAMATNQETGRRAGRVTVYGVGDDFWKFHGRSFAEPRDAPGPRDVLLSEPLAREIGAAAGSSVLLRIQRPTDIPLESLHGRKDDVGRTVRLTVSQVLSSQELGEFTLQPQQGDVRAAFMSRSRLAEETDAWIPLGVDTRTSQINTLLVSSRVAAGEDRRQKLEALVRRHASVADAGLIARSLDSVLSIEADGALIDERREQAILDTARDLKLTATPVLTYLVNGIRAGERTIPYSLATAIELSTLVPDLVTDDSGLPPIVLNEWAARDLGVKPGARVTLDYFVWEDPGRLVTRSSSFELARVLPMAGPAIDRDFAPYYPGITNTENLRDWDPPFPIDLRRIRDVDEAYWRQYRTAPKAFVPESFGRAFWGSRYGAATSIRIDPDPALPDFVKTLQGKIDPIALGIAVRDVRSDALGASRGATDFGEYFTYFSFFLVVSALILTALFFKLGVEQRIREVGLLRAVGFSTPAVRRLFTSEGLVLAAIGSAIGTIGAVAYAQLLMTGLRTWWVDAVGTTALTLHVTPLSLAAGALGGIVAAVGCIWWTLRSLRGVSERALLAGEVGDDAQLGMRNLELGMRTQTWTRILDSKFLILSCIAAAALLLVLGSAGMIGSAAAFFAAGALLLVSALAAVGWWLKRPPRAILSGHGWWSMSRLGMRNASYRPSRSVLAITVMAAATFILISVGAFRREGTIDWSDRHSGTGGYPLLVETVLPLANDPNGADGRAQLGLDQSRDITIEPFRLLPGDDASCLNLYEPKQPKILGVRRDFVRQGRFSFAGTLDGGERENPWVLLEREQDDGAIPVIGDANSMTYVLHKSIGDEIVVDRGGRTIHLRLVAALSDSIFQSELLMSEANFLRLFPEQEGYGLLLIDAPAARVTEVADAIERGLTDYGADAVGTAERLAEFHRVENTYLSTFQTLGGLGLLLGTVGLAAVLLRNVLERRRELALLGAVGYGRGRLLVIVVAESALLLVCGLAAGAVCAIIATIPAAAEHGGRPPVSASGWLMLFAIFATGLISSVVATRAAVASRLLDALRAE